MKFHYTAKAFEGRLVLEADARTPGEACHKLAALQAVFDEAQCGLCQSTDLALESRKGREEGQRFVSLHCRACTGQIAVFVNDDGTIWLKRRDKNGEDIGKNGWHIYERRAAAAKPKSEPRYEDDYDTDPNGPDIPF